MIIHTQILHKDRDIDTDIDTHIYIYKYINDFPKTVNTYFIVFPSS